MLLTIFGVVTTYGGDKYDRHPLYCDCDGTLLYDDSIEWVALPVSSDWQCGDTIVIWFENGDRIVAPALDAGPFGDNCVMQSDGECLPILADIPAHMWYYNGSSAVASILNVSELNRKLSDCQIGYLER